MRVLGAAITAVLAVQPVMAATTSQDVGQCMVDAGKRFGVHPYLIWAVAKTESGFRAHVINRSNEDGSEDIGFMQINSWWLTPRKKPSEPKRLVDYGFTRSHLMDACTNIYAGTWILAQSIRRHGNTWKAVGEYNAATPRKQAIYAEKVRRNLADFLERKKGKVTEEKVVSSQGVSTREMRVIAEVAAR